MIEVGPPLGLGILRLPVGEKKPPSKPGDTYFLSLDEAYDLANSLGNAIGSLEGMLGLKKKPWWVIR